jgi:GDP-L-fucose synthase
MVMAAVGLDGEVHCDTTKPDGTPRKLMDASKLRALDWMPRIDLRDGIAQAYRYFLETGEQARGMAAA